MKKNEIPARPMEIIRTEYVRACKEHPEFSYGDIDRAYVILGEEFGEVGKAIYEGDQAGLVAELGQVAAVCARFLEMMDEPAPLNVVSDSCPICGGRMEGDGYSWVRHCENVDPSLDVEPDADPIFCDPDD